MTNNLGLRRSLQLSSRLQKDVVQRRRVSEEDRVGAGVLLLVFGVWRMISTPATPPVIGEDDPDFTRVRKILACAEDAPPDANLALLGDKRFLFSESGESFMIWRMIGEST